MFDDIEMMEKEIKDFRQNILASSQLVDGINKLIEENKKQQELIQRVSLDYQDSIKNTAENTIAEIERLESATVERVSKESSNTCEEIIKNEEEAIDDLKSLINDSLSQTATRISEANSSYIEELAIADASIKEFQADLTDKYIQFSNRMDNTRVDELLNTCSEMKKSLEMKTMIAIIGICIVIVLEIARFFI